MLHFWSLAVLAGLLPFGGGEEASLFPVEARGEIHFHLDGARFLEGGEPRSELYLSIPQTDLTASPDSAGFCRLYLEAWFEDADGTRLGGARDTSWIPLEGELAGGAVLQPRHLLTLRPRLPDGTRRILVRVENLDGRKGGILDRLRGRKPSGEAYARFEGEPLSCGLSDLVFAWDLVRSDAEGTVLDRSSLRPNPLRYFGLYRTHLLAYLERYGEATPLAYAIRKLPELSVVAAGSDPSVDRGADRQPWILGEDTSSFPAGAYRLEVWKVGGDSCRTWGDFEVLWDSASWTKDQQSLLEEAYVLLGPEEYERLQEMSRGEVEAYLNEIWNRNDPIPATGRNELREIFEERVAHADSFYGTSFRKGMLTDRGRVYIRYGPPDEINKSLNPQDRDLLANILPGEVATDRLDIIRKPLPRDSFDNRAYEIWTYQVRGAPLFPDQMNPVQRTGLKFIFVDELGYGDMRMIYTNIAGAF